MYNQILVKNLTNLPLFTDSTLIVNEHSLYNPFNAVTIMDTREIAAWLNEYEILIIGNYFKKGLITEEFIDQLAQKKLAAIVTKRKFEPFISADILDACDRHNIALIICEDPYSWTSIQTPILELITHRQLTDLKENNDFYQMVIKSISDTQSSSNLGNNIYQVADLSLAILNNDYSFIDYSENIDWETFLKGFNSQQEQVIGELSNQQAIFGYVHTNQELESAHLKVFIYPFASLNQTQQFLLLLTPNYVKQLETRILEKMNTIISIYTLRSSFERQNLKSNFFSRNLTFQQLIAGEVTTEKEKHLTAMLESKSNATYYLIIFANPLQTENDHDLYEINNKYVDFYEHFEAKNHYPKTIHFFTKDNLLAFLVEDSLNPINNLISYLHALVESYFVKDAFKIGFSKAHTLKDTYRGWHEAKDAVNFLLNSNSKHNLKKYQDLGVLSIFISDKGDLNQNFCTEMLDSYIIPLKTYDQTNHTDLLNTLIVFFTMDCSYKQTSDFLYVHVNTLRSRINTIEKLINIDINHTEDKFNLFTAIKVYQSEIV